MGAAERTFIAFVVPVFLAGSMALALALVLRIGWPRDRRGAARFCAQRRTPVNRPM